MSKLAMVFPGQGSQSQNMLADVYAQSSQLQNYFKQASTVLNEDLWQIVIENPQDKLNQTHYTQPILLTADVALFYMQNQKPSVMAGQSLGEYAALVCANSLAFDDAIRLVKQRGEFMQAAVPVGQGAMAAIIGLENKIVAEICEAAQQTEVVAPANYNSTGQIVIAGNTAAVNRAVELAKQAGAKLAKIIPVSVPSHCQLMQSAADKLQQALVTVEINTPSIPVIHNVDVMTHATAAEIKQALVEQLTQPVRWVETIIKMRDELNITTINECGPGKVLTGLIKRIDKNLVGS